MIGAMQTPETPPNEQNVDDWRGYALAYLSEAVRAAAPAQLENPVVFPRSPLEGEGATAAFEFTAERGGRGPERYYVFVGRTEPNYYPAYDLSVEEAFELHLGTRFMLVMGVAQVDGIESAAVGAGAAAKYNAMEDARRIVDRVAPGQAISDLSVAATFDVDGKRHAVLRCRIGGEPVYVFGRDGPHGFSRRVNLPPHAAYRMHIGHVLRREAEPEGERSAGTAV